MAFISYAQNYEDVMLYRALKHVEKGFYIDVGANDPHTDSVTKAFYERGWRGINIEPVTDWFKKLDESRPKDINLQVAVGERKGNLDFYEVVGTGLSTMDKSIANRHRKETDFQIKEYKVPVLRLTAICEQHALEDIHFLKIDVEGNEFAVLKGLDLKKIRPWIIMVESTLPNSQKENFKEWASLLTERGYHHVYFDGLNRFYVADEHSELDGSFNLPPNYFDGFIRAKEEWLGRHAARLRKGWDIAEESIKTVESSLSEMQVEQENIEEKLEYSEARAAKNEQELQEFNARQQSMSLALIEKEGKLQEIAAEKDGKLQEATLSLVEKEKELQKIVGEKDGKLQEATLSLVEKEKELQKIAAEKDGKLQKATLFLVEKEKELQEIAAEKDGKLQDARLSLIEKENKMQEVLLSVVEKESRLQNMDVAIKERQKEVKALQASLVRNKVQQQEIEKALGAKKQEYTQLEHRAKGLQSLSERREELLKNQDVRLQEATSELEANNLEADELQNALVRNNEYQYQLGTQVSFLTTELKKREELLDARSALIGGLKGELSEVYTDKTWRITKPIRRSISGVKNLSLMLRNHLYGGGGVLRRLFMLILLGPIALVLKLLGVDVRRLWKRMSKRRSSPAPTTTTLNNKDDYARNLIRVEPEENLLNITARRRITADYLDLKIPQRLTQHYGLGFDFDLVSEIRDKAKLNFSVHSGSEYKLKKAIVHVYFALLFRFPAEKDVEHWLNMVTKAKSFAPFIAAVSGSSEFKARGRRGDVWK